MLLNAWEVEIFPYVIMDGVCGKDLWHQPSTPRKKKKLSIAKTLWVEVLRVKRYGIFHTAPGKHTILCSLKYIYSAMDPKEFWYLQRHYYNTVCAG